MNKNTITKNQSVILEAPRMSSAKAGLVRWKIKQRIIHTKHNKKVTRRTTHTQVR